MRAFLFERDEGGVAIMAAILLGTVGMALGAMVDIAGAHSFRQGLQRAADAAVIAGVRPADANIDERKAIGDGILEMRAHGHGNIVRSRYGYDGDVLSVTVEGRYDTWFANILRIGKIDVSVESAASAQDGIRDDVDFHVAIDISGSMSIPDGEAEILAFMDVFKNPYRNPDDTGPASSCAFACHRRADDNEWSEHHPKSGLEVARENGIYLRHDRTREEVCGMIDAVFAKSATTRITLYTFTGSAKKIAGPSSDIDVLKAAVADISESDRGTWVNGVMPVVEAEIGANGEGRSAKLVLVTDGYNRVDGLPEAMDPKVCDGLKESGVEIFVVNLEYPDTALYREQNIEQTDNVEAVRPDVYAALEACASPGRYYVATDREEIRDAIQQVVPDAMVVERMGAVIVR